jgi:hypothetical protein
MTFFVKGARIAFADAAQPSQLLAFSLQSREQLSVRAGWYCFSFFFL